MTLELPGLYHQFMWRFTPRWAGIHLGTSGVKIVVLARRGGKTVLEHLGFVEIPEDPHDREVAVTDALMEASQGLDLRRVRISAVLTGRHVNVRVVRVPPKLPAAEFKQVALYEATNQMYLDLDEAYWDAVEQDDGQALVAAAPRQQVDELASTLRRAGIEPDMITVAPLCLAFLAPEQRDAGNAAVVHIGDYSSTVSVYRGRRLLFTRETKIGSNPITDEIATLVGGDRSLAEMLKRYWVLPRAGALTFEPIQLGGQTYRINPDDNQALQHLRDEIARSLRYVEERASLPIARVILTGGGSQLRGLAGYLGLPDSIQTIEGETFAAIDRVDPSVNGPLLESTGARLTRGLGAALRPLTTSPSEWINLVPGRSPRDGRIDAPAPASTLHPLLRPAAYGLLSLVLFGTLAKSVETYYERKQSALEHIVAQATEDVGLPRLSRSEPWAPALAVLMRGLPGDVRLTSVESTLLAPNDMAGPAGGSIDPELAALFNERPADANSDVARPALRAEGHARDRASLVRYLRVLADDPLLAGLQIQWTKRPESRDDSTPAQGISFGLIIPLTELPRTDGAS